MNRCSIIEGLASGVLPPSATYDDRAWSWVPAGDPPADGTLTIRQRRARGRVAELDSYLVEEQPPAVGVLGRVFLLAKQTGEQAEVYQTIIGPLCFCGCTAGRVGHVSVCKHVLAVGVLIADGILEGRPTDEQTNRSQPTTTNQQCQTGNSNDCF